MRWLLIGLIKAYQKLISPMLPDTCRFQPTCSSYFIEAVEKRGLIVGTCKGMWRILRCQPFGGYGYDPVEAEGPLPPD